MLQDCLWAGYCHPGCVLCARTSCVSMPVREEFLHERACGSFVGLCVSFSTTAGFARGGGHGGSHQSSSTGGAAGTSVGSPGTNSAGTALSSGGRGNGPQNGQVAGANPVIDRDEAKVDKMIKSICRGC
jgi:hypothetical protein